MLHAQGDVLHGASCSKHGHAASPSEADARGGFTAPSEAPANREFSTKRADKRRRYELLSSNGWPKRSAASHPDVRYEPTGTANAHV